MPLQTTQGLVKIVVGRPTVDAAVVIEAAHVPIVVLNRLHEAQAVEPQDKLWMQSLRGSRASHPLHCPVWIQRDSFPVSGNVADSLKGPAWGSCASAILG